MKFEIGTENGSAMYDSLDKSIPLEERFLALMVYKFISGKEGVSSDELGCTDAELHHLLETQLVDDDDNSLDIIMEPLTTKRH